MKSKTIRSARCIALLGLSMLTATSAAQESSNALNRSEELSGWKLLFDGNNADQWRNYKQDAISQGWKIEDGSLVRADANAGDIITKEQFKYFELSLEYKISEGGNSGIMFHVAETDGPPWYTGPELQVQDNVAGHDPQKAGWLYQLYQPPKENGEILDATRPAGEWNQVFLRIAPDYCEVDMNGVRYFRFNLGNDDWKKRVAASKFSKFADFGSKGEGHICLQDHGNLVAYRNIKVRELADDGSLLTAPIDGKLSLKAELAFPRLKWEGFESIDEGGNIQKLRVLELTHAKGVPHRLFAVTQRGAVYTFENRPDVTQASLFLDLRDTVSQWYDRGANEQGLLGLAMHPDFKNNGQFFVCYTLKSDDSTIVSRFNVSKSDPLKADRDSEKILLKIPQPFKNHNGGSIEFGPDGMLYIALGDGGLRNDPNATGQDLESLLGSILRINVNHEENGKLYSIPADNPFVNTPKAQPEIYAFGFRNPWRIAFDSATGRLWEGEVGQELWEEINVVQKGGNYGWSNREGSHAFGNRQSTSDIPATPPVWEYDHSVGKSITGGRVYRSPRLPQLSGKYIYADYVSGGVWALSYDETTGTATRNEEIVAAGIPVLGFGEDASGEVYYFIDSARGECIYRFVAE